MVGKRQHYVPRLLQRGFLIAPLDDGERTWLHRHSASPKLVGIRDVGVEDWFYSRKSVDGSTTLDDAITEYERDLSHSVNAFRNADPGTVIDSRHAAEIVVHLVLRAAHLRNLMVSGVARMTSEIEAMFTDPARLSTMIGLDGPIIGQGTANAIQSSAAELVPAGIPAAFSERLMTFTLRELGDQLVANAATALTPLIGEMFADSASLVRDSHCTMLTRPIADIGWVAELAAFSWVILGAERLILSDAVALSRAKGQKFSPLLFTSGIDAELVAMPLSPDRVLVGHRHDAALDLATFNEDAAAAAESFFIATQPMELALVSRIGSGPAEALDQMINEAVAEAETERRLAPCDIPPVWPERRITQDFSYSVHLTDFGDSKLAKEIADVVQIVVSTIARDLPLQHLDGVTIAADYEGALANLDRGDPSLPPVTSTALGYGLGVAMPVTVLREGVRKEHIVLAAGIAQAWISDDSSRRAFGLHTLYKMLAGVAHTTRYASALGQPFTPDAMAKVLHCAVAPTPPGYWAAREAAFVAAGEGATYADCVIESLEFAEKEVAALRTQMSDASDVGLISIRALECVRAILDHAADWLGHRDGLAEGEQFAGRDLPDRLRSRGLDRWIELFGRDLAACYGPEGTLEFAILATLSRHVERLLWALGIYCWPEGEVVRCIVSDQPFILHELPLTPQSVHHDAVWRC